MINRIMLFVVLSIIAFDAQAQAADCFMTITLSCLRNGPGVVPDDRFAKNKLITFIAWGTDNFPKDETVDGAKQECSHFGIAASYAFRDFLLKEKPDITKNCFPGGGEAAIVIDRQEDSDDIKTIANTYRKYVRECHERVEYQKKRELKELESCIELGNPFLHIPDWRK